MAKRQSTASNRSAAKAKPQSSKKAKPSSADDVLRIAVSFRRAADQLGLTQSATRMTSDIVAEFQPDDETRQKAIAELERLGFEITGQGLATVSVRATRKVFEKTFGTTLTERKVVSENDTPQATSFLAPSDTAPWNPDPAIAELIDDAYIQWPHLYFARRFAKDLPSPLPPQVNYHHLRVPGDVCALLNVALVHRQGTTGRGVRVAMVDSGFAFKTHPYFKEQGYNTTTVLAPGATNVDTDTNGHGTGESANLLAIAPDVTFFGIKLDNDTNPNAGASILEGLQEARRHNPQIVSVSLGYDLCPTDNLGRRTSSVHLTTLPNSLKALEAEIMSMVAAGIVVVFSAGNGHVAFPGMMSAVISAGGVYVDATGEMQASDYASSFASKIYPGRSVPDFCGLVGMRPGASYIMLPVPPKCDLDSKLSPGDGTTKSDGWATFSGTSAAAPQIAGVCALLLQKNISIWKV